MYSQTVKTAALELRRQGKMYKEINQVLGLQIPKATLSGWFDGDVLSDEIKARFAASSYANIFRAQKIAVERRRVTRKKYLDTLDAENQNLTCALADPAKAKIALIMLYLGEGSKSPGRSVLTLGNSDPDLIALYLRLLRQCYDIDESKFRATVQCRADQNHRTLIRFWSDVSGIPGAQFIKTQVDPRTAGKPTLKLDYHGVLRVDYLSAHIFHDVMSAIKVIKTGR